MHAHAMTTNAAISGTAGFGTPGPGHGSGGVSASSRTSTTTIIGRHEHTISGYSLLKGLGDGEPIASDRFMVGGHEWVLLFYPDGKRSMSDGNAPSNPPEDPYAALFVALIGEGPRPQGVVQSGSGRVVRAFHRFTLVDQSGNGRHITKGRQREQGAVKISCARQDPTARNCHGYRKFVRRSVLEASGAGYLVDDVVVIKYEIELVVTTGGALNKNAKLLPAASVNVLSYPTIGKHLVQLLYDPNGNFDCVFDVEGERFKAHSLVLSSRSSVFAAMLRTGAAMREGKEGVCTILDVKANVFRSLLHFVYADELPSHSEARTVVGECGYLEEASGGIGLNGAIQLSSPDVGDGSTKSGRASDDVLLDVPMTQHLLVAADRFDLCRLRAMCEARLCESVDVDTVANTLCLAELNHADALKRACLTFIAANLGDVMTTEGYESMNATCPHLAAEILNAVAELRISSRPVALAHIEGAPQAVPMNAMAHTRAVEAANDVQAAAAAAVREAAEFSQFVHAGDAAVRDMNTAQLSLPSISAFSNFLASQVGHRVPQNLAIGVPLENEAHVASEAEMMAAQDALMSQEAPPTGAPAGEELPEGWRGDEPQTPPTRTTGIDGDEGRRRVRPRRT